METIIRKILAGLNNDKIENYYRSGQIIDRQGNVRSAFAHIRADFMSWNTEPTYYACQNFFAFDSFINIASSRKQRETYNSNNQDKIMVFTDLNALINFVNSLDTKGKALKG